MAELKTFLFTDICGSVRLKNEMTGRSVTERDLAFITTVLTPHRQRIEKRLVEMGGRVVSTAGDGHFLVFDNTVQAAQWAVDVQQNHRDDPIVLPGGGRVEVRISVHVGVPQIDPGDPDNFVGKSVDYAARLNDYANAGQVVVSRSVMAILADVGLDGIRLHLHGRRDLKGIGEVEVHELLYDDHGPRSLRNEPKSTAKRQWTVIPTMGFSDDSAGQNEVSTVASTITKVGNYDLEGQLGAGGMGDVYRARHSQFDRLRAVKVIKPQFVGKGHSEVVDRFYNEIKAVGKLEHNNIVVAIDSSAPTDDVHYLVMEYIDGVGLDDLVEQVGPLSTADACEIIRQAANGLQYIHKHQMVHRDIKPSNLMLTSVDTGDSPSPSKGPSNGDSNQTEDSQIGVVKILDLGLALLADKADDRLTRFDNKAMGTGMYMPPEQWRTTSVDIRADIYSLGCTLYHLLSGNPPYIDSDLRPEKAHEKEPLPAIRKANIPRKLWDVLRKMTAKQPSQRYSTPAEVAAALAPFCGESQLSQLVQAYRDAKGESQVSATAASARARRNDTWLSQFRGTGTLMPTRRWLLSTALPLFGMACLLGGAIWFMNNQARKAGRKAEDDARSNLSGIANTAAVTKLAPQIATRFRILTEAANDDHLRQLLSAANQDPENTSLRKPLNSWLETQAVKTLDSADVDSWFILSPKGQQHARLPTKETIGKNYAWRDYFHGGGNNLDREAARQNPQPIAEPNLSTVYKGSEDKGAGVSEKLKVAFSVPIWSDPEAAEKSKLLGVLALSIELGSIERLGSEFAGRNQILLVDTRPDYVEDGKKREGLILDHPYYKDRVNLKNPPRIPPELLEKFKAATPEGEDQFVTGYLDPLPDPNSEAAPKTYWGAYKPVTYSLNEGGPLKDTGWIVLVQGDVH